MNRKKTKRALLSSALAMILCIAMLIGSTYAWFTDTASTAVNKIVSGTLKVGLQYATAWDADGNPTAWDDAEGKTLNFRTADGRTTNILWEPNCTYALPELRVVNGGKLALKYKIQITGIKGDAMLNDVVEWTINNADMDTEYHLLPEKVSDVITIKGHMDKNANNDYQNRSITGISITVFATQDTVENDSFGNQYDVNAPIVYPDGLTKDSFDAAASVLYSKTYGGFSVGTATGADVAAHPAVIAFEKDGAVVYAADIRVAIESGASVIYCKEDATIPMVYAHVNVLRDLTVYANGADFLGDDLSIHAGGDNYKAPENNETTVNIYNAKNLIVWGEPQKVGRIWHVNFYDCINNGHNFFMYRGEADRTDEFHLTMTNCFGTGFDDSIVHATADGSITIKNCVFVNNCAPVNIAHKQSGALTVTVEESKFVNCGKVNPNNDYYAPARFVNNSNVGTLNVTLKNNVFTDTIGTNGDILLGDYRSSGKSFAFTANIVTVDNVMVKSSAEAPYSYAGGTIDVPSK